MITPLDLENKRFSKKMRGYNDDEVDEFLDAVTIDYEKLYRENAELKEKIEDLEFSLEKNIFNLNEETIKNTELNEKIIGIEKRIEEYESILDSKDKIITFQKDNIELLNKKINEIQSLNNELEDNVNKSYLQSKMKEDEVDTLVMIIDGILGRRRDKYEHNLNRLSAETKQQIEEIVSEYEIFDDDE
jgi:cell division initiation protein